MPEIIVDDFRTPRRPLNVSYEQLSLNTVVALATAGDENAAAWLRSHADARTASAVVVFDFDESKHPRVPAGSPGGGEFEHADGGGNDFHLLPKDQMQAYMEQRLIERALRRGGETAGAVGTARILYGERSKYEVHLDGRGNLVEFNGKAQVSAAKKEEVLDAASELHGLYPDRAVDISIPQRAAMPGGGDSLGVSARGAGLIVLDPGAVKPQPLARMKDSDNFMPALKQDDVSATRYIMYHEYGHTMDTPRTRERPEATQRALDTIPGGSRYGRSSQKAGLREENDPSPRRLKTDGAEAFAESFAEWHLTRGQTSDPLSRALADSEHWKSY